MATDWLDFEFHNVEPAILVNKEQVYLFLKINVRLRSDNKDLAVGEKEVVPLVVGIRPAVG
jgi:hypothetical protein